MITKEQIDNLKGGEKLIFVEDGGVLSTSVGNVYTFANWLKENDEIHPGKHYWQCKELHALGNHLHNYSIYDVELFDPQIHKKFVMMDSQRILLDRKEFHKKYG